MPCHNDLLNANFLDDGERLRIVDWEYAGMGDRFFDLANFSINHELDAAQSEALLAAYFGEVRTPDAQALELMRFMSDFREAMWGVVQSAVSELDFDFDAYATEHFERLAPDGGSRRRSSQRSRPERRGAPRGALRIETGRAASVASVGSANSPSCSSSSRSSSSSVPMRTGPLNQFFADSDPPAAEDEADAREPEDRVVRELPVERVVPRQADRVEREDEQDRDEDDPEDRDRRRATCSAVPRLHARGSSQLSPFRQRR